MSRLARCNRCGAEHEIMAPEKNQKNAAANLVAALNKMDGWKALTVTGWGLFNTSQTYDLCVDCVEIFTDQFLKGASVAPITQPLVQTILPHQPMTDCMLVWDPERGGFLCEHDDSERYHKLCRDQAQNCAEGVPPQDVQDVVDGTNEESVVWHLANRAIIGGHELDGNHLRALDLALSYAADQPQMFAGNEVLKGARSSVHGAILRLLRDGLAELKVDRAQFRQMTHEELTARVNQTVDDMETAAATHSIPQRCTPACGEAHTYQPGCLLSNGPRAMQIQDDAPDPLYHDGYGDDEKDTEFPVVPGVDYQVPEQRNSHE